MIQVATVFSGIGAIEYALKTMNKEHQIVFACDNGERMLKQSREEIDKKNKDIMQRAYVSEWKGRTGVVRKITPRECLRLMGFTDDFKIVMNDTNMYRQKQNTKTELPIGSSVHFRH